MGLVDVDNLDIRAPRTRRELEACADLYGKAFQNYERHYRLYLHNVLQGTPREQWRLSRAVWTPDGTPIAHIRICDRRMRLGAARVRVGGIGDVCTHPFHRKHGLMRRLFDHVLDFLREERYDLSILWGTPRFYDKFGFIVALSDGTMDKSRDQAARFEAVYRGRRAKRADAPAVRRLFEADLALRDGAMERPNGLWFRRALREKTLRVLEDDRGRLRAYYQAAAENDALVLREVSLGPRPDVPTMHSLLADMAAVAKRLEKPTLRFTIPPAHPLGQFLVADGCEVRRWIGHRGGAMARVGHLPSLCAAMVPEWERLLAASPVAGSSGRFRLRVTDPTAPHGGGGGTVDLVLRRGRVRPEPPEGRTPAVLTAAQDKLTRLLLGFHSVSTAKMLGELRVTPAAEPLASALLPGRDLTSFAPERF